MRRLIAIVIRIFCKLYEQIANLIRIVYLQAKYPGLTINFKSRIGKNYSIVCVDGGKLIIQDSIIGSGTHLFADVNAFFKIDCSSIGRNCYVVAKESIVIQPGCAIAEMVVIRDQDHLVDTNASINAMSEYSTGKILIDKNVCIAAKATILKNVSIGSYAIIAASAVVKKNVPAYQIWGGVPAKFLKDVSK